MKKDIMVGGIVYSSPEVILLNQNGIGAAEFAGRTAYDSFNSSENKAIVDLDDYLNQPVREQTAENELVSKVNDVNNSKLLDTLAWVHHHHSVIEHSVLTFLIKGTSRGVLQELARHRIASYTVRSTRYTMSSILYAFLISIKTSAAEDNFKRLVLGFDLFVTDNEYNIIEINTIFNKLSYQQKILGDEFINSCLAKDALEWYMNESTYQNGTIHLNMDKLNTFKKKRNVGDLFKHIVTDNWKTDLVMTINLRSLKNFFDLRDSGAAYFLIRKLAEEMKEKTPKKYLSLIDKKSREK